MNNCALYPVCTKVFAINCTLAGKPSGLYTFYESDYCNDLICSFR